MEVYYYNNYFSAGWLALQATALLSSPTLIATMLSPEVREHTVLEAYLSRALGIAQLTLAVLMIILTGTVPLTSSVSEIVEGGDNIAQAENPKAPFAVPTLTVSFLYHAAVAFLAYTNWTNGHSTAYVVAFLTSAVLATTGGWMILFAVRDGKIEKRSIKESEKASGFPFSNKDADEKKGRKSL